MTRVTSSFQVAGSATGGRPKENVTHPTAHAAFDKNLTRILKRAAEKVDRQEFNSKGHVLIEAEDLEPS